MSTALRRIWNKAVHIIRIKDEQRSTYLLVRGVRDDALNDFQSFQPKQTWIDNYDKGALVGQLGIKDVAEVRLISTKGRSLPVIEIWKFNDSGVDHSLTSVIYCDSIDQMENVYNFIKKHKHPDFK